VTQRRPQHRQHLFDRGRAAPCFFQRQDHPGDVLVPQRLQLNFTERGHQILVHVLAVLMQGLGLQTVLLGP